MSSSRFREPPAEGERALGELFRDLFHDASRLIRQEMALARTETTRNLRAVSRDAGLLAAGGVLAGLGTLVLVAALVGGLGDLLGQRYVLAALIVGGVLVVAGGLLAWRAVRDIRGGHVAPAATLASLRDTGGWARAEADGLRAALTGGGGAHGDSRAAPATHFRPRRPDGDVADGPASAGGHGKRRGTRAGARRVAARHGSPERLPVSEPVWKRVWHEFQADDVINQAAKVAYFFFLSLPPAVMALFAAAGFFGGEDVAAWLTRWLQSALPGRAGGLVNDFVTEVARTEHPGLFSFGILATLWAASNVMMALEDSLNDAYDVESERAFVRRRAVALGTLLAVGLLFLSGSVALLAGPAIANALGVGSVGATVWNVVQWPLAFGLITGAFWLLYYFLPNRDQSACRLALLKSSAVAASIWLLATLAFRVYISNFGSYGATYGVLGTVIVLLLWMYLTSMVILLGGEISSEMERQA